MSYEVSPRVKATIDTLLSNEKIKKAMDFLVQDQPTRTGENKEIALIQGETRKEALGRSPSFKERLERYGAKDCEIDGIGNAYGYIYGKESAKKSIVIMETHLDTVFMEDTPLAIIEKDGKIFCPGIGDNASAQAQSFSIMRAMNHAGIKPVNTVMVMGAACEEGKGNFDGMRFFLKNNDPKNFAAAVIVDGGGDSNIGWGGIGIIRITYTFKGPKGHSWHRGGDPSTIHAMGRAVAKIAEIPMIKDPKTTINVGIVSGGSTVGAVAGECMIQVDMRSSNAKLLHELAEKVERFVQEGVAEENAFKKERIDTGVSAITVEKDIFGDMPAGEGIAGHACVQAANYLTLALNKKPNMEGGTCTNGNITVDNGIPTVIMGHGGFNGENHSLNEWYEPLDNYIAAQRAMLTVLALVGVEGITEPLA